MIRCDLITRLPAIDGDEQSSGEKFGFNKKYLISFYGYNGIFFNFSTTIIINNGFIILDICIYCN